MILSAIVAVSKNHAIGKDNQLPWHLPEDLKFFKRTTMGKPMLMGRKTFDSMGALKGRLNIVLTSQENPDVPDGVLVCHTLNEGVELLEKQATEEAFIIGGGKVFAASMPLIERLYITEVDAVIEDATAFFPEVDHSHWKLVWEEAHKADERHKYDFTFKQYERVAL